MASSVVIFLSLCLLEAVLGLDNIFSFAILVHQAPPEKRKLAKILALSGAFVFRVLLLGIFLMIDRTHYPFSFFGIEWTLKGAFLFFGGLFLFAKGFKELRYQHQKKHAPEKIQRAPASFQSLVLQIMFVDLIFAFDSVLVAIAMTQNPVIIVSSILFSMVVMYLLADVVIHCMEKYWRFNILGLILIIFIGLFLMSNGIGWTIDKHVIIATIIFGCTYEGYLTYLESVKVQGKE